MSGRSLPLYHELKQTVGFVLHQLIERRYPNRRDAVKALNVDGSLLSRIKTGNHGGSVSIHALLALAEQLNVDVDIKVQLKHKAPKPLYSVQTRVLEEV